MDVQRIRSEVASASQKFALVEAHPSADGGVFVKAALQTSVGNPYIASIQFAGYPSQMPKVFIIKPALQTPPHSYNGGHICYLHPNYWNPGWHDLTFVLQRAAKWLNKYEVWRRTGRWPGAAIAH
jgi:hypothetical protein